MLSDFLETNEINAQIMTFDEEVSTSKQAQLLESTNPIVKSLLFAYVPQNEEIPTPPKVPHSTIAPLVPETPLFTIVIIEATKKVSTALLQTLLQAESVRLATPAEVEECTGYPVGGIPPISIYGTPTFIDEGVLQHAWVTCGGGDKFSLLKIQSKDILAHAYEPQVVKVAK